MGDDHILDILGASSDLVGGHGRFLFVRILDEVRRRGREVGHHNLVSETPVALAP